MVRTTRPQPVHEIYLSETGGRLALRLKWVLSTLIAGAVGVCIIGVVIYASNNMDDGGGILPSLRKAVRSAMKVHKPLRIVEDISMGVGHKSDRTKTSAQGSTTSQIIQDSVVERRGAREFITVKPYIRVAATLATAKRESQDNIPPFNPFELYSSESPTGAGGKPSDLPKQGPVFSQRVQVSFSPLASAVLEEDGLELSVDDVERLVAETDSVYAETAPALKPGGLEGGEGDAQNRSQASTGGPAASAVAPQTTIIQKQVEEAEGEAEEDDTEFKEAIVEHGDTVFSLIKKEAGAEDWQAHAIADLLAATPAGQRLKPGQILRFSLALAAANPSQRDPIKVSLFTGLHHEATVTRNSAGEYALGGSPIEFMSAKDKDEDEPQRATLYNSIFQAALAANLPVANVIRLLRVHIYDIDYKMKTQPGDSFELFFDTKEDGNAETPAELLFTSLTVGGETYRYYRFRTPDGVVDYYNDAGSSSKKFLMHMPVRGGRFTSGFGYRRHPLLGIMKMHTGVDWAAPTGSPILASGNGVIETAERDGGYGNYVRIKHGNGYKTAYGHLSRFAQGIERGVKVRQGQVIGYVGSTGRSSGPHLHYEVLVNNRQVNPLGISVPRGRQLTGRQIADFRKERARIDALMTRPPVKTRMAAAH